jgi:hypothetical protein
VDLAQGHDAGLNFAGLNGLNGLNSLGGAENAARLKNM